MFFFFLKDALPMVNIFEHQTCKHAPELPSLINVNIAKNIIPDSHFNNIMNLLMEFAFFSLKFRTTLDKPTNSKLFVDRNNSYSFSLILSHLLPFLFFFFSLIFLIEVLYTGHKGE